MDRATLLVALLGLVHMPVHSCICFGPTMLPVVCLFVGELRPGDLGA